MRLTRVLLATSAMLAIALVPTVPASAADQITWPEVQAAAQAAQTILMQGGGTVTDEVSAKISYRQATQYQPGGAVIARALPEAGMADSEPDEVTWTITRKGVETRYQAMPSLPRAGRLSDAAFGILGPVDPTRPDRQHSCRPAPADVRPDGRDLVWSPNDAGVISASWTHGIDGTPDSAITATFTRTAARWARAPVGANGPAPERAGFRRTVQVDFAQSHAYRAELQVGAARGIRRRGHGRRPVHDLGVLLRAQRGQEAREKAGTMSRPRLIATSQ